MLEYLESPERWKKTVGLSRSAMVCNAPHNMETPIELRRFGGNDGCVVVVVANRLGDCLTYG